MSQGKRRILTDAEQRRISDGHAAGVSIPALARTYHVGTKTVTDILRRLGERLELPI